MLLQDINIKFPKLQERLYNTESLNAEEKCYWFEELPYMTQEQIHELDFIYEEEERKLAELKMKYDLEEILLTFGGMGNFLVFYSFLL